MAQQTLGKLMLYASAGLTTFALGSNTLFAKESNAKTSFYENRTLEIVYLEDQPSRLEAKVKELRLEANKTLSEFKSTLQTYVDKWISAEKKAEETVLNLVPKNEKFVPNSLYVGIIALSGNILLRILSPLTLGIGSAYYFLPGTTENTYNLLNKTLRQNEHLLRNPLGAVKNDQPSTQSPASYQSPRLGDVIDKTQTALEQTITEVQSLYTTRDDPGVRPVLERKE